MFLQPEFDCLDDTVHFSFLLLGEFQEAGQREITCLQARFVGGIDPEDAPIDSGMAAMSIFEGQLCFANATQATDANGLGDGNAGTLLKEL